jgi:hypothetical protein
MIWYPTIKAAEIGGQLNHLIIGMTGSSLEAHVI